jgi:hypothetical protein
VFESRMLRRIFRPKMEEVTRSWRKLLNEELHVGHMREKRNAYNVFVEKLERK